MRGTERVHQEFPLRFQLLLIVTRMGRDYRPGPRQRIEQVARQGSALNCLKLLLSRLPGSAEICGLNDGVTIRWIHDRGKFEFCVSTEA